MQNNKINIKSDEITEILGTPPRWIVRWGITLILTVIGVVFIGSIFFQYPDTVVAPAVITAENPPSVVVARANGKPAALFVSDGQWVTRGDTLGVIESSSDHRHIFKLKDQLSKFALTDSLPKPFTFRNLVLGDIQPQFNQLNRALTNFNTFNNQQLHRHKIEALERELKQYELYTLRLKRQRILSAEDVELTHKQFQRDSALYAAGVIAASDFEKSQAMLLAKKQALESAELSIANTAINVERLRQSIVDLRFEFDSRQKELREEVSSTYSQLVSGLSAWEKNYLLIASSTGKLSFMGIWSDVQEVKTGDPLFSITPNDIGEVQARLIIPFEGAGKVKSGQRVNIKLDGYSYMEFGLVEGIIHTVSSGYNDKGYPALAHLPKGVTTSYGVAINFDRELLGIAEITTEDLSLLHRLFSPLKHLYRSKVRKTAD
ncbi:MAG: HlyD family efflux transporter periplasmic adaptor subunit [Bacteroidales bacterium]|jgi:HlyD family secretion protein|nr:HlyD family efflux transporter periplasmic adaptor subunit [Bacteroidales bacterium]MDD4385482.1 HlyD family efflux transporter periplasmic adaptor subunit [Bacteroidales bacterium]MDY0198286.1 HlyD family efflux transporter periplasmic adaptor subunit [Tenuifilaceae bacterium]